MRNNWLTILFRNFNFMKALPMLKSTRFYCVLLACVALMLGDYGILPVEVVTLISSVLGVSVIIRTTDRFSEKIKK